MQHVTSDIDVFANYDKVEKVPILDAVIDDNNGKISTDPANEIFNSFEMGLNYRSSDGKMALKANYYNTKWLDRTVTINVDPGQGSSGDTDIIFLKGLDQTHTGLELELAFMPMSMVRLDASYSSGTWEFDDDAKGDYKDRETGLSTGYVYAVKGLKVGDMPQQSSVFALSLFPIKGMSIQAVYNSYEKHFANWDPISRQVNDYGDDGKKGTDDNGEGDGKISDIEMSYADRGQSWEAPGYSKVDLHFAYDLPVDLGGTRLQIFAHVFNVMDDVFVQEATDNSRYNGFKIKDADGNDTNSH